MSISLSNKVTESNNAESNKITNNLKSANLSLSKARVRKGILLYKRALMYYNYAIYYARQVRDYTRQARDVLDNSESQYSESQYKDWAGLIITQASIEKEECEIETSKLLSRKYSKFFLKK